MSDTSVDSGASGGDTHAFVPPIKQKTFLTVGLGPESLVFPLHQYRRFHRKSTNWCIEISRMQEVLKGTFAYMIFLPKQTLFVFTTE